MTEDEKKGAALHAPVSRPPSRSAPPRPKAPRPSGDRHAAVAQVAALVEEEVELVEEVSVSSPGVSLAASPGAPSGPAAAPEEVPPVFGAPRPVPAADSDPPHSRASRRLPFEIHVNIVSEHNFYAGLSLNISEGGLFVATHVEYPVGTRLEIRLLLPDDEEPTAIMTEVRWVRPHNADADSSPGMGLRFVDLTPDVMAKIAQFAQNRDPLYYEDD